MPYDDGDNESHGTTTNGSSYGTATNDSSYSSMAKSSSSNGIFSKSDSGLRSFESSMTAFGDDSDDLYCRTPKLDPGTKNGKTSKGLKSDIDMNNSLKDLKLDLRSLKTRIEAVETDVSRAWETPTTKILLELNSIRGRIDNLDIKLDEKFDAVIKMAENMPSRRHPTHYLTHWPQFARFARIYRERRWGNEILSWCAAISLSVSLALYILH